MQEIIDVIVNNGLGVGSFICMIYFVNVVLKSNNETLKDIKDTLLTIQTSLITLSERVSKLEDKDKE
jgi:hypothetical protein